MKIYEVPIIRQSSSQRTLRVMASCAAEAEKLALEAAEGFTDYQHVDDEYNTIDAARQSADQYSPPDVPLHRKGEL